MLNLSLMPKAGRPQPDALKDECQQHLPSLFLAAHELTREVEVMPI